MVCGVEAGERERGKGRKEQRRKQEEEAVWGELEEAVFLFSPSLSEAAVPEGGFSAFTKVKNPRIFVGSGSWVLRVSVASSVRIKSREERAREGGDVGHTRVRATRMQSFSR